MGVGDVHPKHATFFPAASESLREDEGKVGSSPSGTQVKEVNTDRQHGFEQDASSLLTQTQRQTLLCEAI